MTRGSPARFGCTAPKAPPSNDTSKSKAKPTRTIRCMKPISKIGKVLTCWTRSGVPKLFAFSGRGNAASALFASLLYQNHSHHGLARSSLRSSRDGWIKECRKPRSSSSGVPRQGSPSASLRFEAASPLKRRSQGLSCVRGNLHAQFLEGRTPAMGSGYSVFPACSFHEDT